MRGNYISAVVVYLALAAPAWASPQHGSAGGPHRGPAPLYVPRSTVHGNHPPARPGQSAGRNAYASPAPREGQAPPTAQRPANQLPHQVIRGQGPHNGDWLRDTMRLPPAEQQRRLEQDQHFRSLPPQRQEQLRNRLQTFNSMPPGQQQRVLNRMEMMEHLSPEQHRHAIALFSQFQGMPQERKQMMRQTLRQMRGMPPEARERLMNSPEVRARFSPQEIQMLHGFNDIGFVTDQP